VKRFVFLLLLPVAAPIASAQESAYQALRHLAAEHGDGIYKQISSVEGREGAPHPEAWRVVVDDPLARGGVREFQVTKGRVASERAPVRFPGSEAGSPIDFAKLNLDSTGAFTLAEEEAVRAKVGFDAADYNLGPDTSGKPVWTLRLVDGRGAVVGTISIGASDGRVLRKEFPYSSERDARRPTHDDDDRYVGEPDPADTEDDDRYYRGALKEPGLKGKLNRFGDRVKRHLYRAGGATEEFFTGNRTIDRDYRDTEHDNRYNE
jgi:hypothetical protein